MSFGISATDFIALGRFAWGLYRQCKEAPSQFSELQTEVLTLYTSLHELADEAGNPDSLLNRAAESRKLELSDIVRNCQNVLTQLQNLVSQYRSLGTRSKRTWDRIKFGASGVDDIRRRLHLHTSTLTLFLTSLGTGSLGRIEKKLDEIAAEIRAGRREPSVVTTLNADVASQNDTTWLALKQELADDFRQDEIETYKDEIRSYIKLLQARGDLQEDSQNEAASEMENTYSPRSLSSVSLTFDTPPRRREEDLQDGRLAQRVETDDFTLRDNIQQPSLSEAVLDQDNPKLRLRASAADRAALESSSVIVSSGSQTNTKKLNHKEEASTVQPPQNPSSVDGEAQVPTETLPISKAKATIQVAIDIAHDRCRLIIIDGDEQGGSCQRVLLEPPSLPTLVAFKREGEEVKTLIGQDVIGETDYESILSNTFLGFTLLMGRSFDDLTVQQYCRKNSRNLVGCRDGRPVFKVDCLGEYITPEYLTAQLIRRLLLPVKDSDYLELSILIPSLEGSMRRRSAFIDAAIQAGVKVKTNIYPREVVTAFTTLLPKQHHVIDALICAAEPWGLAISYWSLAKESTLCKNLSSYFQEKGNILQDILHEATFLDHALFSQNSEQYREINPKVPPWLHRVAIELGRATLLSGTEVAEEGAQLTHWFDRPHAVSHKDIETALASRNYTAGLSIIASRLKKVRLSRSDLPLHCFITGSLATHEGLRQGLEASLRKTIPATLLAEISYAANPKGGFSMNDCMSVFGSFAPKCGTDVYATLKDQKKLKLLERQSDLQVKRQYSLKSNYIYKPGVYLAISARDYSLQSKLETLFELALRIPRRNKGILTHHFDLKCWIDSLGVLQFELWEHLPNMVEMVAQFWYSTERVLHVFQGRCVEITPEIRTSWILQLKPDVRGHSSIKI